MQDLHEIIKLLMVVINSGIMLDKQAIHSLLTIGALPANWTDMQLILFYVVNYWFFALSCLPTGVILWCTGWRKTGFLFFATGVTMIFFGLKNLRSGAKDGAQK